MTGYAFHPEARRDLDEIWDCSAADDLEAADRVIAEILNALRDLVRFPHRGHRCQDLTSRPLRFILVHQYLGAYAPDDKPLWVVAVMHGRRNPQVLAAIFRSRE